MTIDELMKDKKPGEIAITGSDWDYNRYIIPYFKNSHGDWMCQCEEGDEELWARNNTTSWQLYREPKKKVKRWLWVSKGLLTTGNRFMTTEEAFETGMPNLIKLPWSETEFEE